LATKVANGKIKTAKGGDRNKLDRLRQQLPALTATRYFNAGSNGPIPQIAHDVLIEAACSDLTAGRCNLSFYGRRVAESAALRETIAGIFNAKVSEVAIMRSTTEGMNAALNGITWLPGDEVITTQLEHPGLFVPLGSVSHRHNVIVRTIDIGNGGGDVLAQIKEATTPRTRAIAISHVQWSSGAVMPLAEIGAFARERGILTVIDAAQGGGHVDVDFPSLNVDAYCIAGQKWLCGPNSSGIMLLREDRLGDIRPTYLRVGTFDANGYVVPCPGAARFEMGETYGPAIASFDRGLQWLRDEVGFDWLAERNSALGKRCYDGLKKLKGVSVSTPPHVMAGMVCFNIEGMHPKEVSEVLAERGFTIRYVDVRPGPTTARVSAAWWCTEEEVDDLVAEIGKLADERTQRAAD
jgi:L-cysteine/cystine lyase